jgi:PAS domain S-box-containing protein
MHTLLQRQIRLYLGKLENLSESWNKFLKAISEAYEQADSDRKLIEHSLEQMSQELTQRNRQLRQELSEREQREQALLRGKESLAKAQRIAQIGNWEWNIANNEVTWSEELYRIFGLTCKNASATYTDFINLVHPEDRQQVDKVLRGVVEEKSFRMDYRIVVNATIKYIRCHGEADFDKAGIPRYVYGTVHDITENKRIEHALQREKEEQAELNKKLQEARDQLLQSEKMASIGQLAAGVAHEINNPIGYVNSNLGVLRSYIEQFVKILSAYGEIDQALAGHPDLQKKLSNLKKEFDINYLKEDVMQLINESSEGVERVKKIVQNLKDFSHVDETKWDRADIHKGIDSTLNMVNSEIKYKANVVKEYGNLPPIECLSSQLNQVFMNLLVNAAQAIENKGTIYIRTGTQGEEAWIEIADTGAGIAPENMNRIFDPFFTTKPVGQGTGLGLSLCYGIVKKHQGKIEVESQPGSGTTFRVRLPMQQIKYEV